MRHALGIKKENSLIGPSSIFITPLCFKTYSMLHILKVVFVFCYRENDEPPSLKKENWNSNKANGDLKRKQVEVVEEVQFANKSANIIEGNNGSSSNNSRKKSHNKRGKLDFNVLRSPKSQSKRG